MRLSCPLPIPTARRFPCAAKFFCARFPPAGPNFCAASTVRPIFRSGKPTRTRSTAAPANYIGPYPFSEPETRALRGFTLAYRPAATLSYHTKGREIYWEFGQTGAALARDKKIAEALAAETGYTAKLVRGSAGGYKDWCIRALGIPSFTVEAGSDDWAHPVGEERLPRLAEENARIPALLAELVWKTR